MVSGIWVQDPERQKTVRYVLPIATHDSPEIGSSPDVESPPESDGQRGEHDHKDDSIIQGNAPEEDKSDDRGKKSDDRVDDCLQDDEVDGSAQDDRKSANKGSHDKNEE
jgi:hypothetical protein